MGQKRRLARAIAVLAVCVPNCAVTGCGMGSAKLASPGMHEVRAGVAYVRPGSPVSVGEMTVCLTRSGRVTITGVTPVQPIGKIIVQAYAVRPNPATRGGQFLGEVQGTLSAQSFGSSHIVDRVCNSKDASTFYELGLQLIKPTRADVGAAGWNVMYQTDAGHRGTLRLPFAVALCDGVAWEPTCAKIHPIS